MFERLLYLKKFFYAFPEAMLEGFFPFKSKTYYSNTIAKRYNNLPEKYLSKGILAK